MSTLSCFSPFNCSAVDDRGFGSTPFDWWLATLVMLN